MADLSFGGGGIMEALQFNAQRQEQQLRQQQLTSEHALLPFELEKAENEASESGLKARDEGLKFLTDSKAFAQQQKFQTSVEGALKSGKLANLSPEALDTALSQLSLNAGLNSQAVDYAGKASTATKSQADAIKAQLENVTATHNIIASHLDAVTDQRSLGNQIDEIKADLATAGASPQLISSFDKLRNKPFDYVKKEYGVRITNAIQGLEGQLKAAQIKKEVVDTQRDTALSRKAEFDADQSEVTLHYMLKNGGRKPSAAGVNDLSPTEMTVLGALQKAHISVPGGMSGAMLQARVQAYMADIPKLDGEPNRVYADRVAEAAVEGEGKLASTTSEGRRIGMTVGGVAVGVASIMQPGGLKDQYLDLIGQVDLSSFAPARIMQELYKRMSSDRKYRALVTAAQGLASDYAQVMARGGQNVDSQKIAREILGLTSPAAAAAGIDQLTNEMRTVEEGASKARAGIGTTRQFPQSTTKATPGLPPGWTVTEH